MKPISLFILIIMANTICFAHPLDSKLLSRLDSICNVIQSGKVSADIEALSSDIIDRYTEFSDEYTYFENVISVTYYQVGQYRQSLIWTERLLATYLNWQGEKSMSYALALCDCAIICASLGEHGRALKLGKLAAEIFSENIGEQSAEYIRASEIITENYEKLGNHEQAVIWGEKTVNLSTEVYGKNHICVATALTTLSFSISELGDHHSAIKLVNEAISILRRLGDGNDFVLATALNDLSAYYCNVGEYELAYKTGKKSLLIKENVYGKSHPSYAVSLNNQARYCEYLGKYDEAIAYSKEALVIANQSFDGHNHTKARSLSHLAGFYAHKGDYEKAYEYALQSSSMFCKIYDKTHAAYTGVLRDLVRYSFKTTRYSDMEIYARETENNISDIVFRTFAYLTTQERAQFWNYYNQWFLQELPLFAYYYSSDSLVSTLYDATLLSKGILLSSEIEFARLIKESGNATLITEFEKLINLKQISSKGKMTGELSLEELNILNSEISTLEKKLLQDSKVIGDYLANLKISWDDVKKEMKQNEVAIEYFSAPLSKDSAIYCALLLRHDSEYPEMIPLFEEKQVLEYSTKTIDGKPTTNLIYSYKIVEKDTLGHGMQLSQLVWSKILPKIKEGKTIYFAPAGLLHQLAIEHLPYDENRTVSDVYNLVRVSSTREIVTNKSQTEYITATIYGGIMYDLDEDAILAESIQYKTEDIFASRSLESDTLNRGSVKYLPGTKIEAEHINSLLQENNITAKLYTAAKANEESFKSLSGKHDNILHIGTHGFTWTDSVAKKQDYFSQRMRMQMLSEDKHHDTSIDPLNRCGLLFAGANIALQGNSKNLPEGVQDGILTAKEISLMDLRDANLVVLSACETAKGDITSEGVFGLQRAFKMAGVQTIIMSLWKVNDQATQLLMTEFYNNWIGKHQSKRDAFRNAQNTVRTKYEEPEYWAGFIMLD